MTLQQQATVVLVMTLVLYCVAAVWLLIRGWPIRAGLAMAVIAWLPLWWQVTFTDSEAKAFGLLLVVLLPLPLLLIGGGLVAIVVRAAVGWRARISN